MNKVSIRQLQTNATKIINEGLPCEIQRSGKTIAYLTDKKPDNKIISLWGYPMDNSVRPQVFDSIMEVKYYKEKWKDISYFIVAWSIDGTAWTEI